MAKNQLTLPIYRPESTNHVNMVIYSLTGAGKTRFLGTAALFEDTNPILFVDVESGSSTLRALQQDFGAEIDVVIPKNFSDLQEIYNFLRYENTKYKSVGIDSLTEIQRKLSFGQILEDLDEEGDYPNLAKVNQPHRGDWTKTADHMRKFIRAFRSLCYLDDEERRLHVFMSALEKQNETHGVVCPQLPGQVGLECGAFVDILARLSRVTVEEVDEEEEDTKTIVRRHLLTDEYFDEDGVKYLAKNRGDRLGMQVWEPTVEKVVKAWRGDNIKKPLTPGRKKKVKDDEE